VCVCVCVCRDFVYASVRARVRIRYPRYPRSSHAVSSPAKAKRPSYASRSRGRSNRWTSRFLAFADSHFLHDQWSSKYVKTDAHYRRNDCFLETAFSTLITLNYYDFVADLPLDIKVNILITKIHPVIVF